MYKIQPQKKQQKANQKIPINIMKNAIFFKNSEQIHEPQTLPLFFKLIQTNS